MKCRSNYNFAALLLSFVLIVWNCKESHQLYIEHITATSTSLTIEWNYYYGSSNFTVLCTCNVSCSVQPAEQSVMEAFNVTIDELHPYTNYSCCVWDDTYGFSDCGNVQTTQAAPSAAPQITYAAPNGPRSIHLQWGEVPEEYRNGPITSYFVRIKNAENGVIMHINGSGLYRHHTRYGLDSQPPYRCSVAATTAAGTGPYSTEVEVHIAPYSAPRNLVHTAITSRHFSISWDPPAAEDFTGSINEYRLNFRNILTGYEWTGVTSGEQFNVYGLKPYHSYSYEVAAETYAVGPYTASQTIQTLEDDPESAPQLISAVPSNASSIRLEWREIPLADRNGIITGYTIRIKEIPLLRITTHHTSSIVYYTVPGLDHRVPHNCSVAARTSVGTGPFGEEQQVHIAPYSAPQNVFVNSTSYTLTVHWRAPRSEDYTGSIQQYRVNIRDTVTNDTREYNITSDTNFTVDGLHPYRTYNCAIAAVTYAVGPYSDTVSEQTDETAPTDSPRNLSSINATENSVFLSWEAPFEDSQNGIITHYVVKHTLQMLSTYTNATSTRLVIDSLKRRTKYEFRVAASTRVGMGPFSDPITTTTTGELIANEIILAVVFILIAVAVVIGATVLTIYGVRMFKRKKHPPAVPKRNYYIDDMFTSKELELKSPSTPQQKSLHCTNQSYADDASDRPRSHYSSSSYYSSTDDESSVSRHSPPTTPPLPIPKRSPICKKSANHDEQNVSTIAKYSDDGSNSYYTPTSDEETYDFHREESIASQSSFGTPPPIPKRSPISTPKSANNETDKSSESGTNRRNDHDEHKDSKQTGPESIYQPLIPLLMMNKDGVPLVNFPVNETDTPYYDPLVSVALLGDQTENEYASLTHVGRAPPQTQPKKKGNSYQPLVFGKERLQGMYEEVRVEPEPRKGTHEYEPTPFEGERASNTQPSSSDGYEFPRQSNKKRVTNQYPTHCHVVLRSK